MKTVGKQLQEARLAKNWTPELAARETKIKVERVRDLEADDYSHFTSPTYARGFVRTYARALGLDEYRILRQLDNKLPDDDSANIVTDTGVAYLPETAMPPRAAHRDFTGLYIVMGLGAAVALVISVVLFKMYQVGELSTTFASNPEPLVSAVAATNTPGVTAVSGSDSVARALPVDSNTPPPIEDATTNVAGTAGATNAASAGDTTNAPVASVPGASPRALPVDLSQTGAPAETNAAPAPTPVAVAPAPEPVAPRAMPVDPSDLANAPTPTAPPPEPVAPRALPVDPSDLVNGASGPDTLVAANTVTPPVVTPPPPTPSPSLSARQSNSGPVVEPAVSPVAPPLSPVPAPLPAPNAPTPPDPAPQIGGEPDANSDKRLVLTASQDSYVRVTSVDDPAGAKPLYAAVLHSGQSVGFDGKKFSINVGIPAAVDIKLDGVNYGPHSDQSEPETFTVQSHLP